jgi:adenylate cyclase
LTGERVERRLAAVLAADVAGYSRLMGVDEEGTLARLKAVRKALVDPTIASHRGRIVKTTGDGMLVEFASAVDAVRGAVEVQRGMTEQNASVPLDQRIEFRIGIHVGDIIIDDNDIFGDGVNVAARLEGIAERGGVCISNDAYRQVRGKVEIVCDDMGPQLLKNITEPMQAWRVRLTGQISPAGPSGSTANETQALPLPDKPSIAVLPFQNMSGDPEQEYFADGMVDDIITALSRFKSLFVIARNSSFTYKNKAVDIKQVGRELGVHYVLEGSVRKAGGRVRITCQLIEAASGVHVYADKFDGDMGDVFALQDRITEKVAAVIEPNIKRAEVERALQRRQTNLSAYDLYLRALPLYYSLTPEGLSEALRLCYRALEIDPRYGAAARFAGELLGMRTAQGWSTDVKSDYSAAFRFCRQALDIDDTDADALAQWGRGLGFMTDDYQGAADFVDRAVAINPNSARAWSYRGWAYRYMRHADEALMSFERAIRLNPLDPTLFDTLTGLANTLILAGRDEEASVQARKALALNPRFTSAYRCLAASTAYLGREREARDAAAALMEIEPSFRINAWAQYGGPWQGQRLLDGLRLAGLPE